jgi:hypothetical protein
MYVLRHVMEVLHMIVGIRRERVLEFVLDFDELIANTILKKRPILVVNILFRLILSSQEKKGQKNMIGF